MYAEMYATAGDGMYLRLAHDHEEIARIKLEDETDLQMWLDVRDILQRISHEAAGEWQRVPDYSNPVYRVDLRPY